MSTLTLGSPRRRARAPLALFICLSSIPLYADEDFPMVTMSALLMTLGVTAVFLLYRYLKRLQTEHAHMLRLIRHAPAALLWFDGKGRLIGANKRFLTLSGYRLSQLRGQLWTERLLPTDTALRLTHLLRTGVQKETTNFSASFIKADGNWLNVVLDIEYENGLGIAVVREAS